MDPAFGLRRIFDAYDTDDCEEIVYAVDDLREWLRTGGSSPAINYEELDTLLRLARNYATERLAHTTLNEVAEEFLVAAENGDYGSMSDIGDKLEEMLVLYEITPTLAPARIRHLIEIANSYAHAKSDAEDNL